MRMRSGSCRPPGWRVEARASRKGVRTTRLLNRGLDPFWPQEGRERQPQTVSARIGRVYLSRPSFPLQIMFTP